MEKKERNKKKVNRYQRWKEREEKNSMNLLETQGTLEREDLMKYILTDRKQCIFDLL